MDEVLKRVSASHSKWKEKATVAERNNRALQMRVDQLQRDAGRDHRDITRLNNMLEQANEQVRQLTEKNNKLEAASALGVLGSGEEELAALRAENELLRAKVDRLQHATPAPELTPGQRAIVTRYNMTIEDLERQWQFQQTSASRYSTYLELHKHSTDPEIVRKREYAKELLEKTRDAIESIKKALNDTRYRLRQYEQKAIKRARIELCIGCAAETKFQCNTCHAEPLCTNNACIDAHKKECTV